MRLSSKATDSQVSTLRLQCTHDYGPRFFQLPITAEDQHPDAKAHGDYGREWKRKILPRALRLLADTAKGSVTHSLAREGGLQSTLRAGTESISRTVRQDEFPV